MALEAAGALPSICATRASISSSSASAFLAPLRPADTFAVSPFFSFSGAGDLAAAAAAGFAAAGGAGAAPSDGAEPSAAFLAFFFLRFFCWAEAAPEDPEGPSSSASSCNK